MSAPPPRHPVWDNHFHLDPHGKQVEAVKEFERAGGTHLMLVHKPYHEEHGRFNRTVDDHRRQMEITLRLAQKAREATSVQVFVALSPHPAEFTKLLDAGVPTDEAAQIHRGASEVAAAFVREGKAVALGEVGRPHWQPVAPHVWEKANELMRHSFELARDLGCAVQIHAETATPESFADLRAHADRAGLPVERVVKHYSTPIVDTAVNHGLWPSVLIGKGSAEEALKQGTRFLMETDYMDEPVVLNGLHVPGTSTGAVLGPKTVPRRTKELIAKGLMTEEQAWIIHAENPRKVYGIEVEL